MDRRVLLLIAFILTVGGLYGYLNDAEQQPEAVTVEKVIQPVAEEETVPVWIVKEPIKKGQPVTTKDFQASKITETQAEELELDIEEQLKIKKGSRAGMAITAGTVLTKDYLITPDDPEYINLTLTHGMVPYPLALPDAEGYAQVVHAGDKIDVVMISSQQQNLANRDSVDTFQGLSVSPLLRNRTVLKVDSGSVVAEKLNGPTVILELTRKEVSKIMLAKRIGILDIYKASAYSLPQVRTGDVLPDFSSVVELRGSKKIVN